MKKITVLLLTGLMLTVLTGCGGNSVSEESSQQASQQTSQQTTQESQASAETFSLTVWAPQNEIGENNDGWLPVQCEAFDEAHPEWDIDFTYEVCGEGDAGANVTRDPSAAGDVYFYANDQLGILLQANAVARLGGEVLEQITADNTPEMTASVTVDGGVYGVPFSVNTWFMYYDKSVFTEEDVKSLDTMLEVAEEKGKKVSFPLTTGWYFASWYVANGGTLFGDGNDAQAGIRFDEEHGGVEVTEYLVDLVAHPAFLNDTGGAGLSGLSDGTVACYFSGTWDAENVKNALGDNWAATLPPAIEIDEEEKQLKSFGGTKAIGVNPACKNPKAAAALAAWLGSSDAQLSHYEYNGTAPVSVKLRTENEEIASNPAFRAALDTVSSASVMQPSIPEMSAFWDAAEAMGNAIYNGDVTHANAEQKTEDFNRSLNGN